MSKSPLEFMLSEYDQMLSNFEGCEKYRTEALRQLQTKGLINHQDIQKYEHEVQVNTKEELELCPLIFQYEKELLKAKVIRKSKFIQYPIYQLYLRKEGGKDGLALLKKHGIEDFDKKPDKELISNTSIPNEKTFEEIALEAANTTYMQYRDPVTGRFTHMPANHRIPVSVDLIEGQFNTSGIIYPNLRKVKTLEYYNPFAKGMHRFVPESGEFYFLTCDNAPLTEEVLEQIRQTSYGSTLKKPAMVISVYDFHGSCVPQSYDQYKDHSITVIPSEDGNLGGEGEGFISTALRTYVVPWGDYKEFLRRCDIHHDQFDAVAIRCVQIGDYDKLIEAGLDHYVNSYQTRLKLWQAGKYIERNLPIPVTNYSREEWQHDC